MAPALLLVTTTFFQIYRERSGMAISMMESS